MATIPDPINSLVSLIDQAHERNQEPPRKHLGCSVLGHPCDRWLWLSFRWAVIEKFPGRILRLFRRGQNEESTMVADLRAAGLIITHTGDFQSRVEFGCHIGGSMDGIIESGVPEAPHKRHVAEFKTHSLKSFDDLQKQGVEKSKPQHYTQMQLYMLGTNIDRALYVAVCKDDDRLYTERVKLDKAHAEKALERGKRIALSDRMPEPLSTNPSWYQCKFCPGRAICFDKKPTQEINCRTCAWSTAKEDGTWRCEKHEADDIPMPFQRYGCDDHVLHMDLVPWKNIDNDNDTATFLIDGKPVKNGRKCTDVYSSREILANPAMCANPDAFISALRTEFDGEIVS